MKKIIMTIILVMAVCSWGTDANTPTPNDMIRQEISAVDAKITAFEQDPNSVIDKKLASCRKFLADENLGDDMRSILSAFEFILVERPGAFVQQRLNRLSTRKTKLQAKLPEEVKTK